MPSPVRSVACSTGRRDCALRYDASLSSADVYVPTAPKGPGLKFDAYEAPAAKKPFSFDAPAEAKELSLAEANAGKWFTDLNEAKKAARASGRKIFVDFMATWCGPCKLLDKNVFTTQKFKNLGGKMVFLRIDVDAQENIASAYKIEAMPTQMLLNQDGEVLSSTVGYGGLEAFFAWINGALGSN